MSSPALSRFCRLHGLEVVEETVKAVSQKSALRHTPLKRGVNESGPFANSGDCQISGLGHLAVLQKCRPAKFLLGLACLAWFCCATAVAMDFSGPLQNVQVTVSGGGATVTYSVTDPIYGIRQGTANTPGNFISTPSNTGGVVAWVASSGFGSTVYYRIYDPGRSNWMEGSTFTAATPFIGPLNDSGLVAWQAGNSISFAVYDPIAGSWNVAGLAPNSYTFLVNNGGTIACLLGSTVRYVTYDPLARTWVTDTLTTGGFNPGLTAASINSGVVAWQSGNVVYMSTYDVARASWRWTNGGGSGVISGLVVANSSVIWSSSQNFIAGYNSSNGTWTAGATPAHASFLVSTNSGNPPLFVWFTDLSLGGTSWSWNFGDGATATGRTPYHVFNGLGRYPVVQTVAGTVGTSTAGTNILTDLLAPAGSMLVNNGDPYTRSTNVTLTLSVTDNSGVISAMRFSNTNNSSYSPWVPYATNYPWTMNSGDGVKSVYGQFMDPSSNISVTIFDSITLDSRPPPLAFITDFSVSESTPSVQVTVQLSDSTPFRASVDYATSDGTATGGSDYASASGRLVFQPFETSHAFTLFITNDTLVELNETFFITLSNPTNATVGLPATVTILDDDRPTVSFATNLVTVDEYVPQVLITATLNAPSGLAVSVNYASSNGTATAGSDYSAVSGTLSFSPGVTSRSFPINIQNDTVDEPDETVRLYLSNPTNALLGAQSSATLIIIDDDPPPASFTTNNFLVSGPVGTATISVRLNTPFAQTVLVGFTTSDDTAKAGSDYVAASGTLIFGSGATNQSFFVTILNNPARQTNTTILLGITSLNNATPGLFTNATLTVLGGARLGSSSWNSNTGFHSTLSGTTGYSYAIEMSSNLTQWLEITRVTNTTGTVDFTDPAASSEKKRYYRARQTN